MITVTLNGGLGNQMFQYSLGRALQDRLGVGLALDIGDLRGESSRDFRLNVTKFKADRVLSAGRIGRKMRFWQKPYFEKSFSYDSDVWGVANGARVTGYWQSYRYFDGIRREIREELSPASFGHEFLATVEEIEATANSVGIHVRRGDYVSNSSANSFHGLVPVSYYKGALERIIGTGIEPNVFVFSDDPGWVGENLILQCPFKVVDGLRDYEDLFALSHCNYQIIANSTFSWWSAYLRKEKEGGVYAPKKWFTNSEIDTSDLFPPEWTLL